MNINHKYYKLNQTNTFNFTLHIKGEYKYQIYQSIAKTKILEHIFYDDETDLIHLTMEKAHTLKTKPNLSHDQCIKLIQNICQQMEFLEKQGLSFYGFNLDDILVINEFTYIVVNPQYLLPIEMDANGKEMIPTNGKEMIPTNGKEIAGASEIEYSNRNRIRIVSGENRPYFSNPEIIKLRTLPAIFPIQIVYYSLGTLIVFCLLKTYLLVGNEIKSEEDIEFILRPLHGTKIYWFLKRCLHKDPNKRLLLLI